MTTPTACRALSARIQAGDKTVTNAEVYAALGFFEMVHQGVHRWMRSYGIPLNPMPDYLTSVDATRAEWPDGWFLRVGEIMRGASWYAISYNRISNIQADTNAPTEPAARAALLLEIRAVELEAKENNNG